MSEIELLIIVLELFKLRCRGSVDRTALKELNSDVLSFARSSKDLSDFKEHFGTSSYYCQSTTFKLRNKFLKYLDRFDDMYSYISNKPVRRKIRCYEL